MKGKRISSVIAIFLLFISTMLPTEAAASTERTLKDESIYDLLVDRFNNGIGTNDVDVDATNRHAFNGGDFAGIQSRLQHISEMGFTMISIGPVFETDTYDGAQARSYEKLEPHFGTVEELTSLVKAAHEKEIKVIADFPMNDVSKQHDWVKNEQFSHTETTEGTIQWDSNDDALQQALLQAVVDFVTTHDLDGVRLTKLGGYSDAFVNEVIAAVHETKAGAYVITNEESDADFDATRHIAQEDALRQAFTKTDANSSGIDIFTDANATNIIQLDDLSGSRLTYEMVEARMFPPTRWKVAVTALFTLPGVPLMTYGSEIAVNGKEAPDSHPLLNFKTDMELKDLIGNLNTLRNQSETLRNGDFKMLHNQDGFMVYTRTSEDETWLIAVNNTSKTVDIKIPAEQIGEKKKLRGLLDSDLVKETDDGYFHVVLDRELAEVYIADEDKGFNIPYLIASLLVYILFLTFLFLVIKKGRARRKAEG